MPDSDLDIVANALIGSAYGSAGERCMAVSVAVAVGVDLGDRLVEKLIPRVRGLKIRDGMEAYAGMGPIVTAPQKTEGAGYLKNWIKAGAPLLRDGRDVLFS